MPSRPKLQERRQFTASVLLPVVLVLLLTAAAVLGFVFWSAAGVDQRALERQNAMFEDAIQSRRTMLEHELSSVAIWDDALTNVVVNFNQQWVDNNLGQWLHEFFGHDQILIIDEHGNAIYEMISGTALPRDAIPPVDPAINALVARLRNLSSTQGIVGTAGQPRSVSDFTLVDGQPAIVAAMAIVSDTGTMLMEPDREPLLVTVLLLDNATAAEISRNHLFDNARFTMTGTGLPHHALHPVSNAAGRFITFFEWLPDRPGQVMLHQTGMALVAGFIVAAGVVLLLLRQVKQATSALDAGRRDMEHQASHDALTGLPNRRKFDRELARAIKQSSDHTGRVTVMMLDLDRFKQVNDTLGHQAGDDLLCAVAERLRLTVGSSPVIARLGGDEFAMIVPTRERSVNIMALAERIIFAIGQPYDLVNFKVHVGVSIGIAHSGVDATPHEMLRKADIALYEAKASGRNRAAVFEEQMNELLQLQHIIDGELRNALRRSDQLDVIFQPLVDQKSRKVIGAEALARWDHPKYGQISPARFIPIAENTGQIEALGEFVLRKACDLGARSPGRTIAVNISPTQLRNPRFANQVFDILHAAGMRATDLELEITESILLEDEHTSALNLRTLRTAGIQIALDDFGTGYSSLSYLKRYPVQRIKIDRSFVQQLTEGHASVAITRAIVTLAHAMDLEVTAEGVETEAQATILGRLGCNTLQGFLFSGGVSGEKIMAVFADKANAPERRRRTSAA